MGEYGSLSGMRVIVTGASRGIGRAVAIACARHGATVGVNYHRSEAAARELLDTIGSGVLLPFDVGDPEAARAGVRTFVERTGGVDALVNNAAIVRPSLLVSAADEDVEAVVRTNVLGVLACTRAALAPMLAQRSGVIVNVGSVAAASPGRGQAVYAATKAAVDALAAAVNAEYARKGIRCECVALGAVNTEMLAPTLAVAGAAAIERVSAGAIAPPDAAADQIVACLAGTPRPPVPVAAPLTHDALHRLMETRRSVRTFRPDMPSRELIESVLASAVTAPSASNKQPWRFVVVRNAGAIARMAAAVRAAVDRIAVAVEPEFEPSFRAYGDYFTRFERAPLVIVPICRALTLLSTMTGARLDHHDAQAIAAMERDSGLIGTSLALQNLLLAAHARGLGASGMTGPLVAADAIRDLLGIPASWQIVALVPMGFPDENPPATARKAAPLVTQWMD